MPTSSKTDWDRIKREAAAEAPVAHGAESPYDPNDPAAVDAFWDKAIVRRQGERGPQKAPVKERVTLRLSADVVLSLIHI